MSNSITLQTDVSLDKGKCSGNRKEACQSRSYFSERTLSVRHRYLRSCFPPKKRRCVWESITPSSSIAKRRLILRIFSFCLQYKRCSLPLDRRNLMGISASWSSWASGGLLVVSGGGVVVLFDEESLLESALLPCWVDLCFRRCFLISRTMGLCSVGCLAEDFTALRSWLPMVDEDEDEEFWSSWPW